MAIGSLPLAHAPANPTHAPSLALPSPTRQRGRRALQAAPQPGNAVTWMLAIRASFPREEVEDAIEAMIAALDAEDGDPDRELTRLEDDFLPARHWTFNRMGPGCPIADRDCCDSGDDDPERCIGDYGAGDTDDSEDDDPAGDGDPDREALTWPERIDQPNDMAAGLRDAGPFNEPWELSDDVERSAVTPHWPAEQGEAA